MSGRNESDLLLVGQLLDLLEAAHLDLVCCEHLLQSLLIRIGWLGENQRDPGLGVHISIGATIELLQGHPGLVSGGRSCHALGSHVEHGNRDRTIHDLHGDELQALGDDRVLDLGLVEFLALLHDDRGAHSGQNDILHAGLGFQGRTGLARATSPAARRGDDGELHRALGGSGELFLGLVQFGEEIRRREGNHRPDGHAPFQNGSLHRSSNTLVTRLSQELRCPARPSMRSSARPRASSSTSSTASSSPAGRSIPLYPLHGLFYKQSIRPKVDRSECR